jgi:hypothetical protein
MYTSATLASAGKLTATEVPKREWMLITHAIFEKFAEKLVRMAKNLLKKHKKSKNRQCFVHKIFVSRIANEISEVQCCSSDI